MIDYAVWSMVVNRTDFQVTLEFAEGLFHVQQPLVMTQDLLARTFVRSLIGMEQIPAVLLGFLDDQFSFAFPLQLSLRIGAVTEILVRLEPLQSPTDLAGQLLLVDFLALDGSQSF